jgi:hypothetical protein
MIERGGQRVGARRLIDRLPGIHDGGW